MNAHFSTGRRQRGLSLVEASVALVIMGLAAMALWQGARGAIVDENLAKAQANADRAERALATYVALNGRFPCPAVSRVSGLEDCSPDRTEGYYPFLTTGLPEAEAGRLRYVLDGRANQGDGDFQVLINDQPITTTTSPRALPKSYRSVAPGNFDRMLDVCEMLTRIARDGLPVYTLALEQDDNLLAGQLVRGDMTRQVNALEVSAHLNCPSLVSLAGRSQFRAHLTGAIMAKAIQDYRVQTEIGYTTYVMDLAEGAWNAFNGLTNSLLGWAKMPQAASALMANFYGNPAPALANFLMSFTTKLMGTAALGARFSNVARFSNNLKNYKDHLRILNHLVNNALAQYAIATQHAQLGASSAYFLSEQTALPAEPVAPGPASDYGPNSVAQALNAQGLSRAGQLGLPGDVADAAAWPGDAANSDAWSGNALGFEEAPFRGVPPSADGKLADLK